MAPSPWLLAFDTSTPRSVIVLGRADSPQPKVTDARVDGANQASSPLVPRIEAVIHQAGLAMEDLAAIVCGCGPGTFTGTRVGVATAKGLSLGLGCPLFACSSLRGIAASSGAHGLVLGTLDARRNEVYAGLFEVGPPGENMHTHFTRGSDEVCAPLDELMSDGNFDLPAGTILVGPGIDAYTPMIPSARKADIRSGVVLTGVGLWRAAQATFITGEPVDRAAFDAVYLRASYAEMGLNTPKRKYAPSPFLDPK